MGSSGRSTAWAILAREAGDFDRARELFGEVFALCR